VMVNSKAQNLVEKLAQRYAVDLEEGHIIQSGDYISIRPAHVMTHDNTGAVIPKFKAIGAKKVANPRQVVFALDHNVQDKGEANLKKYARIEAFAAEMGIDFYPAGRGIGHQIMCEEGYAWPMSGNTHRSHRCGRHLGDRAHMVAGATGSKSKT